VGSNDLTGVALAIENRDAALGEPQARLRFELMAARRG
jgi:hypothetical protein